ncbi:MAG: hypothetical protein RLZZ303_997 [Candidatus Hydrogenedentota bacterium]
MKLLKLESTQEVPAPLEEVWPFFATPANLERMTPDTLRMGIITPGELVMKEGALFDYVIRMRGVPMRWTTLITACEPPHRFIDVQLRGPYSYWHHTHTFERREGGGTILRDEVLYGMPFGPLGLVAHALMVKRDLNQIFQYRRKVIEDLFGVV